MNLSYMLLQQILVMAIYILFGYLGVRFGILRTSDSSRLASLVLYIISPALILDAFQISFSVDKMKGFLLAVLASVMMHILFLIFVFLLKKATPLNAIERASLIYPNCGNLLVPLIGAILGKEYVIYCCAFMSVQLFIFWTHGAYIIGGRNAMNLKKFITNPNVIATVLGLVFFFTGIRLPMIPATAIEKTGACIAPVSMFVIGILIASSNLKRIVASKRSWMICLLRLLAMPLLTVVMLWASRIPWLLADGPKVLFVSFLASAAPVAVNVTQLADVCGEDSVLAGSINILSVFLCILTMPLMTAVYQWAIMG
ncbi:MAG: AEC family transporter [Eubacterium sp.]|nr:AEC family transporter [Eubacterium sp.]